MAFIHTRTRKDGSLYFAVYYRSDMSPTLRRMSLPGCTFTACVQSRRWGALWPR